MVGAALAAEGPKAVYGDGLIEKVMIPALVAPVLALVAAGIAILICYRIVGRQHPGVVSRGFRLGQIVSGSLFSLSHGTNDAQKTMGIIFLALVANGNLDAGADLPTWVVVSAATAIALGTYVGGWRIIRTMGSRIIKMDPAQGFAAQGVGAAVILSASHVGFPLSTTHVISGGIMGAGAAKRFSAVRWGVAGNIAVAWVLTLPAAAVVGGVTYGVTRIFGTGAAGPVVVSAVLLALLGWVFTRRLAGGPDADGGGLSGARSGRGRRHLRGHLGLACWRASFVIDAFSLVVLGMARSAEARAHRARHGGDRLRAGAGRGVACRRLRHASCCRR